MRVFDFTGPTASCFAAPLTANLEDVIELSITASEFLAGGLPGLVATLAFAEPQPVFEGVLFVYSHPVKAGDDVEEWTYQVNLEDVAGNVTEGACSGSGSIDTVPPAVAGGNDGIIVNHTHFADGGESWLLIEDVPDPEGDGNPAGLSGASALFDGERVLVLGGHEQGWGGSKVKSDVWAWDGTSWDKLEPSDPEGDAVPGATLLIWRGNSWEAVDNHDGSSDNLADLTWSIEEPSIIGGLPVGSSRYVAMASMPTAINGKKYSKVVASYAEFTVAYRLP